MPLPEHHPGLSRVRCRRRTAEASLDGADSVVVEEPLELRIGGRPVATVMRTPGSDRALALGFLLAEGWISERADIGALMVCAFAGALSGGGAAASPPPEAGNVVDLIPGTGAVIPDLGRGRVLPTTSSCGVCGKRTIEEVLTLRPLAGRRDRPARRVDPAAPPLEVRDRALLAMPSRLREAQALFSATGALHAAGLFDEDGRLLWLEEDIGRHNAVDKVVGWAFLENRLPLERCLLQVSGRASFEIVQKAYRAGIPLVAAVSGVSSLAVELAERVGITLVGFVRERSFTVYSHRHRVERVV